MICDSQIVIIVCIASLLCTFPQNRERTERKVGVNFIPLHWVVWFWDGCVNNTVSFVHERRRIKTNLYTKTCRGTLACVNRSYCENFFKDIRWNRVVILMSSTTQMAEYDSMRKCVFRFLYSTSNFAISFQMEEEWCKTFGLNNLNRVKSSDEKWSSGFP